MRRAAVLLTAVLVLALTGPATPAHAGLLLAEGDEVDLANGLADAQEQQDICYGWSVTVDGQVTDQGSSSAGPGQPLDSAACPRYALFEAVLDYACETCDAEDTAAFDVRSNLPDPPTPDDLRALGFDEGDLLGEDDDAALSSMAGALPLLAAERGNAGFVDFETPETIPAADRPTGTPGSDFLRDAGFALVLFGFLAVLGPILWLWRRRQPA